jgi:hypothetical protein
MRRQKEAFWDQNGAPFGMKATHADIVLLAKHWGCGNCGEQSAVAFDYLRGHGIRPIEWYQFVNLERADHAFVVINRRADSDRSDPTAWPEAAICDPWENKHFRATDFWEHSRAKWRGEPMHPILTFR